MKRHRRIKWPLRASATAVVVGVLVVCAAWVAAAAGDSWLAQALRSRVTVVAGSIFLTCAVLLFLLAGAMWRLGRQRRQQMPSDAGTASIEFVLVFPVALAIVLVMIQSMLLVTNNLFVHYSAYIGARAAVVWVPERVTYVEDRNRVSSPDSSVKMQHIYHAAVWALTPAGASKEDAAGSGMAPLTSEPQEEAYRRVFAIYGEDSPGWITRMMPHMYAYAQEQTEVTLDPPASNDMYGDTEDLTVTVRHIVYLGVPYVGRAFALGGSARRLPNDDYGTEVVASYTLTNQGVEDNIDAEIFPRYVGRGEE